MARVALSCLGCKLNQAEMEALARAFRAAGHEIVEKLGAADIHVVNTCTVTNEAARDSRRLARRRRPHGRLLTVVTGCHATTHAEELQRIPGVDLVVSNAEKRQLVELVERRLPQAIAYPSPPAGTSVLPRTRAAVKIQDGCSVGCAYCVVPRARGREQSRAGVEILAEVQELLVAGAQEIVLTGVQISAYANAGWDLQALVECLLTSSPIRRLRLSSLAPWSIGARELAMWRHPRLCRHVHLSLQSGSSSTLQRMRRPISAERFAAVVDRLRAAIGDVAITTDVIVGFPGETHEEFRTSLEFVTAMQFARIHVFTFSPRPGTAAAAMPDQVPAPVVRARAALMRAAAAAAQRAFLSAYVGRTVEVLWEGQRAGWWEGHTDTYVTVRASGGGLKPGSWGWVAVEGVEGDAVWGRPVASLAAKGGG